MTGKELYDVLHKAATEINAFALPWRCLSVEDWAVFVLAADALSVAADAELVEYVGAAIQEREDAAARRLYEAHCRLDVAYSHLPWEHMPEGVGGWGRSYWRQLAEAS